MSIKERLAKEFADKIQWPDDDEWTKKQRYLGFIAGFTAADQDLTLIEEEVEELMTIIMRRRNEARETEN